MFVGPFIVVTKNIQNESEYTPELVGMLIVSTGYMGAFVKKYENQDIRVNSRIIETINETHINIFFINCIRSVAVSGHYILIQRLRLNCLQSLEHIDNHRFFANSDLRLPRKPEFTLQLDISRVVIGKYSKCRLYVAFKELTELLQQISITSYIYFYVFGNFPLFRKFNIYSITY